jgi:hypothetical protein
VLVQRFSCAMPAWHGLVVLNEVLVQRFSCAMPSWHGLVVLNEVHAGAKRGACSQV